MKNRKLIAIALPLVALVFSATAHAQQFNTRQGNAQNNPRGNANNRGLLPLPPGIANLIAVDAQNSLLAETDGENGEPRQYFGLEMRHVYAGAIARLFGGEVIPTAPFVSPYFVGNNGFGANNGFGNTNGGFNGNNTFNNGGLSNGTNFGNNGFGNNGLSNNFNNFNNGMR